MASASVTNCNLTYLSDDLFSVSSNSLCFVRLGVSFCHFYFYHSTFSSTHIEIVPFLSMLSFFLLIYSIFSVQLFLSNQYFQVKLEFIHIHCSFRIYFKLQLSFALNVEIINMNFFSLISKHFSFQHLFGISVLISTSPCNRL